MRSTFRCLQTQRTSGFNQDSSLRQIKLRRQPIQASLPGKNSDLGRKMELPFEFIVVLTGIDIRIYIHITLNLYKKRIE